SPSRRRSNTKSTREPSGGTVIGTAASASRLQIRVGMPFTSQNTASRTGDPRRALVSSRQPSPASNATASKQRRGTGIARFYHARSRPRETTSQERVSFAHEPAARRGARPARSAAGRLPQPEGTAPERRGRPVRGGERARGAPAGGQRAHRAFRAADAAAAGHAGRRARRPLPVVRGGAGVAGRDRRFSRPPRLPRDRRAPRAGRAAAGRARRGRAPRSDRRRPARRGGPP